MPTTLLTGSASGIGAATRKALEAAGHRVIGVDLHQADICGDLSQASGRQAVLQQALQLCNGVLDGLVLCAGLGPQVQPPSKAVSVNFFGVTELLDGLLPALQKGQHAAAVVVSSVASAQLGWAHNPLAAALQAGDEAQAGQIVDGAGDKGGRLKKCRHRRGAPASHHLGASGYPAQHRGPRRGRDTAAASRSARRTLRPGHQKLRRATGSAC